MILNLLFTTICEVKKTSTNKQVCVVSIILPFKDQKSADIVRRQLTGRGSLIGKALRGSLVFTSRIKIRDEVKVKELETPLYIINALFRFKCDLCEADYVGLVDTYVKSSTH